MTESEPSCPECLEQARIIGKGAERELAYQARIAELEAEIARLRGALTRLRDCDWVITPHDRMDAVRDIARAALEPDND